MAGPRKASEAINAALVAPGSGGASPQAFISLAAVMVEMPEGERKELLRMLRTLRMKQLKALDLRLDDMLLGGRPGREARRGMTPEAGMRSLVALLQLDNTYSGRGAVTVSLPPSEVPAMLTRIRELKATLEGAGEEPSELAVELARGVLEGQRVPQVEVEGGEEVGDE